MRLHETLKQCQDLKTEKSQMDRKINQLSEENGDLSFKVCYPRLEALGVELFWTISQEGVENNFLAPVWCLCLSRDLHILPLVP